MNKFCMLSGLGVLIWLCHHACQQGDMTITGSKLQKLGSLAASLSLLYNDPFSGRLNYKQCSLVIDELSSQDLATCLQWQLWAGNAASS